MRTLQVIIVPLLLLVCLLLTAVNRSLAQGTSIVVTTMEDELLDNGKCSLREAIRTANLDTAVDDCAVGNGADSIRLPEGTYRLFLVGTGENQAVSGDLDILEGLTIHGDGATTTIIDGSGIDRVLEIHGGIEVVIQGVTVQQGLTGPGNGTRDFAEASTGGGIVNHGVLRLENIVVTGNRADGGDSSGTDAFGGGIFNNGTLTLVESQVSGNQAQADNEGGGTSEGGGIYNSANATLTMEQSNIKDNSTIVNGGGIANHGTADLRDFTATGNEAIGWYWGGRGGGLYNEGEMSLTRGTVNENRTTGRHGSDGGGIANEGTLTIEEVTVQDNRAEPSDFAGRGGGIWNRGTLTLGRSIVNHNRAEGALEFDEAGSGGGIWNAGALTVAESTISQNTADLLHNPTTGAEGGGITNQGTLTLTASTVSENVVKGSAELENAPLGGGIMNHLDAQATIANSTISGNVAEAGRCAGRGGGLMNRGTSALSSSTITNNRAEGRCDEGDNAGVGAAVDNAGTLSAGMTIIAGNLNESNQSADCSGALSSRGYNLIGDSSGCALSGNSAGNLTDVDQRLGPLEDNGGRTFTHALLPGSPAIDAGTSDSCPPTDQRGQSRPQDGDRDGPAVCDIGAFEVEGQTGSPPPTATGPAEPPAGGTPAPRDPDATATPTVPDNPGARLMYLPQITR